MFAGVGLNRPVRRSFLRPDCVWAVNRHFESTSGALAELPPGGGRSRSGRPRRNGSRKLADTDPADRAAIEPHFAPIQPALKAFSPGQFLVTLWDYRVRFGLLPAQAVRVLKGCALLRRSDLKG